MLAMVKRLAVLAAATLLLSATAHSDDNGRTVPANRETAIGFHAAISDLHCAHTGKPTIKITAPPKHGTLRFEWTTIKFDGRTTTVDMMACKGKSIRGMAIYYRPNKGFKGEDQVKIGMIRNAYYMGSAARQADVLQYDITVK